MNHFGACSSQFALLYLSMQDEIPKEQAWQGGIRFERTCKDFGHSVKGFALYVFFVSVAVFGLFLFVIRMAQTFFHLNILEFAGRGQRDRVWCCTLHRPGLFLACTVFEEQQPFC